MGTGPCARSVLLRHLEDELLQLLLRHVHARLEVGALKVKIELARAHGLIALVVQLRKVRVVERLLHGDAVVGVEHEHARDEVQGGTAALGEVLAQVLLGPVPHLPDGLLGGIVRDESHLALGGGTDHAADHVELVRGVPALEERLAAQHLREDAAERPHVDGLAVVLALGEQLGRSVPARHDVLCQIVEELHLHAARKAEVADGQVAVGVDEQVARLHVAVQHVGRVDVLEAAEDLVHEVLEMLLRQRLARADDAVQVALHEVGDDVRVREILGVGRHGADVQDLDHVLVRVEVAQQLDLAQNALGIDQVREHVGYLLDGHLLPRHGVERGAHHAVGTGADGLQVDVARVHLEHIARHRDAVVAGAACVQGGLAGLAVVRRGRSGNSSSRHVAPGEILKASRRERGIGR